MCNSIKTSSVSFHQDKANKRWMLMAIDRRKKKLKVLRRTRYDSFEKVCQELGITYTFPPEYYRRVTRRWLAKKAFCNKVMFSAQPKCPNVFFCRFHGCFPAVVYIAFSSLQVFQEVQKQKAEQREKQRAAEAKGKEPHGTVA